MGYVYKQLTRQMGRNKIFIALLFLLIVLTSLSYFFVKFSIDGNLAALNALPHLSENQALYHKALTSNTTLANVFLLSLIALTGFVLIMFFYRFYRSNKKQIGTLKALGFKDRSIRIYFTVFTALLSVAGALVGMLASYFLSKVLINAYIESYQVAELVRVVNLGSILTGLGSTTFIFSCISFVCYMFIRGKEPGALITGNENGGNFTWVLGAADRLAHIVPIKNKFPLRLALRKPLAVLLILIAVVGFSVCVILGQSLNISSQRVYDTQTVGHNYAFETTYSDYKTRPAPTGATPYLASSVRLAAGNHELERTIIGLYNENPLFQLQDDGGEKLAVPKLGSVLINPEIAEIYGVDVGDKLSVTIRGAEQKFLVSNIAYNAKSACIYVNAEELASILSVPEGAYNGLWSMEKVSGGSTITKAERMENIDRDAVSNKISAVINQLTGALVGCLLIFLALLVNFQDNTRDMLILHMIGYRNKIIRKLLVNVYLPIIWASFIITLAPSILAAQAIQHSLSISTNDYMPFGTNPLVLFILFILMTVIYWLVQWVFSLGVKHTIKRESITELTSAE